MLQSRLLQRFLTKPCYGRSTSALFLLSSDAVMDKVQDAFKGDQFEIIATNLSKEQEEQLKAVFEE